MKEKTADELDYTTVYLQGIYDERDKNYKVIDMMAEQLAEYEMKLYGDIAARTAEEIKKYYIEK